MCLYLIKCVFPSIFSYPMSTSDCLIVSITSLAFQNPQNLKMSAGVAGLQDKLNKSLNQKGMVSPYLSRSRRMDKFLVSPKQFNKTHCEVMDGSHSQSVTKNRTAYWSKKTYFSPGARKAVMHSFPTTF